MGHKHEDELSRRERQIMDIVYARGRASAAEVHQAMTDAPSYSAVRTLLGILEQKGQLRHEAAGKKYIYLPTTSPRSAGQSAMRRLLNTFFGGSTEKAMAALLQNSDTRPDDQELGRLAKLIEQVRKEGR